MVFYYNEIREKNGRVLSLDNVRINFVVSAHYLNDFRAFFSSPRSGIELYPECHKDFKYKYLFTIAYVVQHQEFKMTCGFVFNGTNHSEDVFKGYLDFNPNKIGSIEQFWADFGFIKSCCEKWDIPRVDIAYDIPVARENIVLKKDNRKYAIDEYSLSNRTEYLGLRSHAGFVKVYNKQQEANLDYPLTRIEITCEPNKQSFLSHFPLIYDITEGSQFSSDLLDLNDTNLAILRMELKLLSLGADEGLCLFNSLSPYIKQKLGKFLLPESCLVFVDASTLDSLIEYLCCFK